MEFKLDEKVVEAAAKAPQVFVSASLGEGEENSREPGIQLTKEQLISLRKYEVLGTSFPTRYADVVAYLKYGAGDNGGSGLTAADFQHTFKTTHDHAKLWGPLSLKIKLTGTNLKIFANNIIGNGDGIFEVYDDLPVTKYLERHNLTTLAEYEKLKNILPNLPGLGLGVHDISDIDQYLNNMFRGIKSAQAQAEHVREELNAFGLQLSTEVKPQIQLRLGSVTENTYQTDIELLQKQIDLRSASIDELQKQYEKLVQEAIASAATMNIGGLILGIYHGVKAEKIRKERNKLTEEQQAANQLMASKNQTLASLNRLRGELQNLNYVTIEADAATQNLILVWNSLANYVKGSREALAGVEDAIGLRVFIGSMRVVVGPWVNIAVDVDHLLKVFDQAEKEYAGSKLMFKGGTTMMAGFNISDRSEFNVEVLRASNNAIQETSISAQVLSQKFNYLPGVVDAVKDRVTSIGRLTFQVRVLAQSNRQSLQNTQYRLKASQVDFYDYPDEVADIRAEMETELQKAFKKIAAQTEDLKGIQLGISGQYDKNASKSWIATLEGDRAFAQKRKVEAEEKNIELQSQMTSVSEAISLIEKAGIEKIGQEVQLTQDKLMELGMAPPQVQVALLAMDTLKKLISGIGESISYLNMLAGYERLREKAVKLKEEVDAYSRNIVQIDGKIRLVNTLDELDDQRWEYVNEFSKMVADFENFTRKLGQDKSLSVEERADTAIAEIKDFANYLMTIQR